MASRDHPESAKEAQMDQVKTWASEAEADSEEEEEAILE